MVQTSTGYN